MPTPVPQATRPSDILDESTRHLVLDPVTDAERKKFRRKTAVHSGLSRHVVHLDDVCLFYQPYTSASYRNISVNMTNSSVAVRYNPCLSKNTLENALARMQDRILANLNTHCQYTLLHPVPVMWKNGSVLPLLDHMLPLSVRVLHGIQPTVDVGNDSVEISLSPEHSGDIAQYLQNWLTLTAHTVLRQRFDLYCQKMGIDSGKLTLTLSAAKSRWGACVASHHISLNWRLIFAHIRAIDYVVVHELAHTFEMNHGKRFHEIVKSLYPLGKPAERYLADHVHYFNALFA